MKSSDRLYKTWLYSTGPTVSTRTQAKKNRKKFRIVGLPRRKKLPKWKAKLPPRTTLEQMAADLASNPTRTEKLLYSKLLTRRCHFQFNRPLGPYIPDFYFPNAKLIVECDGIQHNEPDAQEYDRIRDDYFLTERGIETMRFPNEEVINTPEAVVKRIIRRLDNHLQPNVEGGVCSKGIGSSPVRQRVSGRRSQRSRETEVTATCESQADQYRWKHAHR